MEIGRRVQVVSSNKVGIIRYIGTTDFAIGEWIGLELEKPEGKNNGTVNDRQYFECALNYGLFIKKGTSVIQLDDTSEKQAPRMMTRARRRQTESGNAPAPALTRLGNTGGLKPPVTSTSRRTTISTNTQLPSSKLKSSSPVPSPVAAGTLTTERNKISPTSTSRRTTISTNTQLPSSKLKSSSPATNSPVAAESLTTDRNSDTLPASASVPCTITDCSASSEPATTVTVGRMAQDEQEKLLEEQQVQIKNDTRTIEALRLEIKDNREKERLRHVELETQLQKAHDDLKRMTKEQEELLSTTPQNPDEATVTELKNQIEILMLDNETIVMDKEIAEERIEELEMQLSIKAQEEDEIQRSSSSTVLSPDTDGLNESENLKFKYAIKSLHERLEAETKTIQTLEAQILTLQPFELRVTELEIELQECQDALAECKEMLDVSNESEAMVEELTEKNLNQSDEIQQLRQSIATLESLKEMSEEMEEQNTEYEKELQSEIQNKNQCLAELSQELKLEKQTMQDREQTIVQFRAKIQTMQEEIQTYQSQIAVSERKQVSVSIPSKTNSTVTDQSSSDHVSIPRSNHSESSPEQENEIMKQLKEEKFQLKLQLHQFETQVFCYKQLIPLSISKSIMEPLLDQCQMFVRNELKLKHLMMSIDSILDYENIGSMDPQLHPGCIQFQLYLSIMYQQIQHHIMIWKHHQQQQQHLTSATTTISVLDIPKAFYQKLEPWLDGILRDKTWVAFVLAKVGRSGIHEKEAPPKLTQVLQQQKQLIAYGEIPFSDAVVIYAQTQYRPLFCAISSRLAIIGYSIWMEINAVERNESHLNLPECWLEWKNECQLFVSQCRELKHLFAHQISSDDGDDIHQNNENILLYLMKESMDEKDAPSDQQQQLEVYHVQFHQLKSIEKESQLMMKRYQEWTKGMMKISVIKDGPNNIEDEQMMLDEEPSFDPSLLYSCVSKIKEWLSWIKSTAARTTATKEIIPFPSLHHWNQKLNTLEFLEDKVAETQTQLSDITLTQKQTLRQLEASQILRDKYQNQSVTLNDNCSQLRHEFKVLENQFKQERETFDQSLQLMHAEKKKLEKVHAQCVKKQLDEVSRSEPKDSTDENQQKNDDNNRNKDHPHIDVSKAEDQTLPSSKFVCQKLHEQNVQLRKQWVQWMYRDLELETTTTKDTEERAKAEERMRVLQLQLKDMHKKVQASKLPQLVDLSSRSSRPDQQLLQQQLKHQRLIQQYQKLKCEIQQHCSPVTAGPQKTRHSFGEQCYSMPSSDFESNLTPQFIGKIGLKGPQQSSSSCSHQHQVFVNHDQLQHLKTLFQLDVNRKTYH